MKLFSATFVHELAAKAAASPRARAHHNVHATADDPVQRFFVAANRQSYFRPHRHRTRSELVLVLYGAFDFVTFDDAGGVLAHYVVGAGGDHFGYETPRDVWHTLIARTDGATFLEVKEGPYEQTTAAQFASWAPEEGDARVPQFMDWLRGAEPGASKRC
jgi:cupin fold WbuC family metalloprotein